jgi:hypothetical protein
MDRLATGLGMLGVGVALGALVAGELVVSTGLAAQTSYIDANLAKTLTAPLHLRCAQIVLVACIALAMATPRWIASRVATAMALSAVGLAALHRLVVLPKLYATWAQADLVAGRPPAKIAEAQALAEQGTWLALATGVALVGVVVLAAWAYRRAAVPAVKAAAAADAPTATPASATAAAA